MDPDYMLPPPAYSEQEFDQKISQAIALSLHISPASIDSNGFPQHDPAAFETPEGSSTSPTTAESSSPVPIETYSRKKDNYKQHDRIGDLPPVVPLRIEKKTQSKSLPKPPVISRPGNESSSTIESSTSTVFHSEISNHDDFGSQPRYVQTTHGEGNVPLMPLSTASSLQQSTQIAHREDTNLSSMLPPPPFEAQPPTSLPQSRSFDGHNHQQYIDPYNVTQSQSPRQSLPIQPRPRFVPQERPMTSYSSSNNFQSSYVPHLDFNPSIAYGRNQPVGSPLPLKHPVKSAQHDPHSFYNSAVSAQITPTAAAQHGHPSYSSYNYRNSFSPQKQYQQQGSTTYSRPGHYSQSYVSQDPLSSERSSAVFDMNNSRQPVLQSPARSSSNYSMTSNYQTSNTSPSPVYQYHTANGPGNIYYDQQNPGHRWSTQ